MIRLWIALISAQLIGYLVLGRTFGYIGIPALKIFIGEIVLGGFAILRPRDVIGRLYDFLLKESPFSGLAWTWLIFFAYGVFEFARGIGREYPPLVAAQNLVFNYYPLYILLGLWAGLQRPALLEKLIPVIAWLNGFYGIAYCIFLDKSYVGFDNDVSLFGQPNGTVICILALICFWKGAARSLGPLILNVLVLIGLQVRADWLSCLAAIVIFGLVRRRIDKLMAVGIAFFLITTVAFVADVKLPGSFHRGGDVSVRSAIGRVLAPIDVDLAQEYTSGAKVYDSTVEWRTKWWRAIWDAVHDDSNSMFLGLSYGYPLGDLVPYLRNQAIRTPHSVFFYALGYGGWFGVAAAFLFQSQIAWLGWRTFRVTGQAFALVVWVHVFLSAFFGNVFETPAWAIPFYLLVGLAWAPILMPQPYYARVQVANAYDPRRTGALAVGQTYLGPGAALVWTR